MLKQYHDLWVISYRMFRMIYIYYLFTTISLYRVFESFGAKLFVLIEPPVNQSFRENFFFDHKVWCLSVAVVIRRTDTRRNWFRVLGKHHWWPIHLAHKCVHSGERKQGATVLSLVWSNKEFPHLLYQLGFWQNSVRKYSSKNYNTLLMLNHF